MATVIGWIKVRGINSVYADPPTAEVRQDNAAVAIYCIGDDADPATFIEKKLNLSAINGGDTMDAWWSSVVNEVYTAEGLTPP